jgi:hypothetical protein
MFKPSKKFSGLSGLCEAGLEGNTDRDPGAVVAAVKSVIGNLPSEIDGLAARVKVFEDGDVMKTLGELLKLKGVVEGLQNLKDEIPADKSDEIASLAAKLEGVQAQLLSGAAAPGGAEPPKGLGETIFEDEGFQAMISDSRSGSGVYKIKLKEHRAKALGSVENILAGVSAAPILAAADLGALRWSTRQTEIVMEPKESVAEFVPAIGVIPAPGFQVYEWPKETLDSATGYMRTTLVNPIDGDPTPKTSCDVVDASHFVVGTYVRFFDASRNLLGRVKLVSLDDVSVPNTLTFATNALTWDQAADTNVTSEHWLGTPEGEQKPYTLLAGETTSVNAVTIAIMAAVTRQQLLSPSGVMAWIQQELPSRTRDNIAQQLLYGAGTTGKSLQGFMTYVGAQSYLWSDGEVGDNRIDAILRAVLQVLGGTPSIVMNKSDFSKLRLQKDTNENYLLSATIGRVSLEMVGDTWVLDGRYPIIESEAILDNDFLVCDFASASKIINAEDESLEWGVINDDFALNQRRARYELTLAHSIQRRKSFVVGQWDNAPT